MIRVSHFSTLQQTGGAARAAWRLHRALGASGLASTFVVHRQETDDRSVVGLDRRFGKLSFYLPAAIDDLVSRRLGPRDGLFRSAAVVGRSLESALQEAPCDVAHLHWINGGFLRPEALRQARRPLFWTLHDQWAFCGAEHYPATTRYESAYASDAPGGGLDLDRWVFRRKRRAYAALRNLTLIAPSRWMRDCAARSTLFRDRPIEVVPYAIDLTVFKPLERRWARTLLGLPQDATLVLSVALNPVSDPRKGWAPLEKALRRLAAGPGPFELAVVGASSGPALPVPAHYLGQLHDDVALAAAYAAADVFVCPSLQDNLPNTVLEALSCGTPTVAFAVGGLPDLVEHQHNGWLAKAQDDEELAAGLAWVLAEPARRAQLSRAAREGAELRHAPALIAARHRALYEQALAADLALR